MGEILDIDLWLEWFAQLDRTFIFLLLLPLVVAVVGLWAAYREKDIGQRHHDESVADRPRRPAHVSRTGGHRYNQ